MKIIRKILCMHLSVVAACVIHGTREYPDVIHDTATLFQFFEDLSLDPLLTWSKTPDDFAGPWEGYEENIRTSTELVDKVVPAMKERIPDGALESAKAFADYLDSEGARPINDFVKTWGKWFCDYCRAIKFAGRRPDVKDELLERGRKCINAFVKMHWDINFIQGFHQRTKCVRKLLEETEGFAAALAEIEKGCAFFMNFAPLGGRVRINAENWKYAIDQGAGRQFMVEATRLYRDDNDRRRHLLEARVSCADCWKLFCTSEFGRLHYVLGDMYNISTMVAWYRQVIDFQDEKGIRKGAGFDTLNFSEPNLYGLNKDDSIWEKFDASVNGASAVGNRILLLHDSLIKLANSSTFQKNGAGYALDPDYNAVLGYLGLLSRPLSTSAGSVIPSKIHGSGGKFFEDDLLEFVRDFVRIPFHLDTQKGKIANESVLELLDGKNFDNILSSYASAGRQSPVRKFFKPRADMSQGERDALLLEMNGDIDIGSFVNVLKFAPDEGLFRVEFDKDIKNNLA
ncbi:MAG: hypothetical protein LBJ89_02915 [Holosporales bacterium]|jgi:hypothetical protein|nr:hypothetical protein [Holosporales bacterium]